MRFTPTPINSVPIRAEAAGPEVVVFSDGPGVAFAATFTPEAVLDSLEALRSAAEQALRNKAAESGADGDAG